MLRSHHTLTLPCSSYRWAIRSFTSSPIFFQLQANEKIILGTHGAGVIRHDSMSQQTSNNFSHNNNFNNNNSSNTNNNNNNNNNITAAPPADLFRTNVHEGTGTSERDPYVRTLPNLETRPPESTVSQTHTTLATTFDECMELDKKWGSMQYWLGDKFPRLPVYLKQLQIKDAPPLSPAAESLLLKFESIVIPKLISDDTEKEKLMKLWKNTVHQVELLEKQYIFDKSKFELKLLNTCKEALEEMRKLSLSGQEGNLAIEALRRQTILRRNKFIQENFIDLTENRAYLGFGDAVWRVFFHAVESNEKFIFNEKTLETIRFTWDAIMYEDVVRLPDVTAPVALFLTLVSINESSKLVNEEMKELSKSLDEGIKYSFQKNNDFSFSLINPTIKRRFVSKTVSQLLQFPNSNNFSKLLRENGLHDLSREVALCEAMNSYSELYEADVLEAVSRFESKGEVKTLLSSLMGGNDVNVQKTVSKILGISNINNINWEIVMQSVDWTNNWRRLAISLLSDQVVLIAIFKLVKNAIGAKGVSKHLFTEEYAEELQKIINIREERETTKKIKIDQILQELSSYQKVDQSCDILRQLGVDMTELDQLIISMKEKYFVKRPNINKDTLFCVLEAISNRHPNWVKAGVIELVNKDNIDFLRNMLYIFIRLSYIPQTGAAIIAQRSRRRIGAVGLESYQFNIPTEIGFVEQYDNLQYKRYDWQGWYQRMVDIHNRNVSLRCRINDLKRLDANGIPFVDMQTERRLRILANERVGMGVLKLDSDKYEDQSDNMTFGAVKLSELLADARKAQLGEEYWPSVEIKVRKPSGQSKTHYSLIDFDRIEKRSKELYAKYREAKKRSLFVTPMDMWLEVKGVQARKATESADAEGYTVDALQDMLNSEDEEKH